MRNHDACKFFRREIKVLLDFVHSRAFRGVFWAILKGLYFLDAC